MSEPLRSRQGYEGDLKRDLEFPPLPEPLAIPVYDNHTHLGIADGEGRRPRG